MGLISRFFPLLLSIVLHGVVLWAAFNRVQIEKSDLIEIAIYTPSITVDSANLALKKSFQEKISASSESSKSKVDHLKIGDENTEIETASMVDDLITEEPVIISEPKSKQRTEEARRNAYTGTAQLKILIDAQGQVQDVKLLNSLKYGLNERAIELAKQIKLSPAKINGKPVSVVRDFTINFEATDAL